MIKSHCGMSEAGLHVVIITGVGLDGLLGSFQLYDYMKSSCSAPLPARLWLLEDSVLPTNCNHLKAEWVNSLL